MAGGAYWNEGYYDSATGYGEKTRCFQEAFRFRTSAPEVYICNREWSLFESQQDV